MKEIEVKIKEQVAIVKQKEHPKKFQLIGHITPQKGQTVFELDLNDGMIRIAQVESVIDFNKRLKKKLVIKHDHLYCTAINFKNADRKFSKMITAK